MSLSTGSVTTLAGAAVAGAFADSSGLDGTTARFYTPRGIVRVGSKLYVFDHGNYRVRVVDKNTGYTTTLAGTGAIGSTNGAGTSATFGFNAYNLTTDGINLYVGDGYLIRQVVISSGFTSTLAGSSSGAQDSTGADGTTAKFAGIFGMTVVGGNLYVADTTNFAIRKIVIATGLTTTFAGTLGSQAYTNGVGAAARFTSPLYLTNNGTQLLVGDLNATPITISYYYQSRVIRSIDLTTASVQTYLGPGGTINIPLIQLPTITGIYWSSTAGLLFPNYSSALYRFE